MFVDILPANQRDNLALTLSVIFFLAGSFILYFYQGVLSFIAGLLCLFFSTFVFAPESRKPGFKKRFQQQIKSKAFIKI